MSTTDELVHANEQYAASFAHAGLDPEPTRRVVVVTCMDARLDVYRFLDLKPGQAHVVRNAGGVVTDDVIRSLLLSGRSLGTEEVVVIQHTKCGVQGLDDRAYADDVESERGVRPWFSLGGFGDVEDSVRSSLERMRTEPLVGQASVRGFVYDVDTGRITEVE